MTNEEKTREIINCGDWCESINKCDYKNTGVNCYAYGIAMRIAEWKEQEMIEKLKEMEIEDGDIEDFANEEQSSKYGLSEKFIARFKKEIEE